MRAYCRAYVESDLHPLSRAQQLCRQDEPRKQHSSCLHARFSFIVFLEIFAEAIRRDRSRRRVQSLDSRSTLVRLSFDGGRLSPR